MFRIDVKVDAEVHIHPAAADPATTSVLQGIAAALQRIETNMGVTKSDILTQIAQLKQDVADGKTVEQSAITLIQGMNARIADLLNQIAGGGMDLSDVQTALTEIHTGIAANTTELAAGVAAGTEQPTGGGTTNG